MMVLRTRVRRARPRRPSSHGADRLAADAPEPLRRRSAHHHPLRAQASRLRSPGRAVDRRGVPRDRAPGADRIEQPGLAVDRDRRTRRRSRRWPTSTPRTSQEYRTDRRRPTYAEGDPRGERMAHGARLGRLPHRELPPRPGDADPVHRGPPRQRAVVRGGGLLGLVAAGRVELHARPAASVASARRGRRST